MAIDPNASAVETMRADTWPRLMRAETAAAYLDEVSVRAFLRFVGSVYPDPVTIPGKGKRWLRDDLDHAISKLARRSSNVPCDAADLL